MAPQVLISRAIDPFFAMGVGLAAAVVRINREEKEKGQTTSQTVESLKRRIDLALGKENSTVAQGAKKA